MATPRICIIDNNAIDRLHRADSRAGLDSNLRCVGREFWPTTMNITEAMKSRDKGTRIRLLKTLHSLAGTNHAITLPTAALKKIAEAHATGASSIDFSEPGATYYLREPEAITSEDVETARAHLVEQEESFRAVHERAKKELKEPMIAAGGRARWPTMGDFLDDMWSTPGHLGAYIEALWSEWGFPGSAPVETLLSHPAWKIYFDGWGAAFWTNSLAHPQPSWAESADLQQLVYLGIAPDAVLATDDTGLQEAGIGILEGRHPMRMVVPVDRMIS